MSAERPSIEFHGQTRAARYAISCEERQTATDVDVDLLQAATSYQDRIDSKAREMFSTTKLDIEALQTEDFENLFTSAQPQPDIQEVEQPLGLTPPDYFSDFLWKYAQNMAIDVCIDKGIIHPTLYNPHDSRIIAETSRIYGRFAARAEEVEFK